MGSAFILHGWSKIQQPFDWMGPHAWAPWFLQGLAACSEFGGGIALLLGLLTPLACLGIVATMLTALFTVHFPHGPPFIAAKGHPASFETPLLYLSCAIVFLILGPGTISLDALLFKSKRSARKPMQREQVTAPMQGLTAIRR
jgi:putative oxidoreductase